MVWRHKHGGHRAIWRKGGKYAAARTCRAPRAESAAASRSNRSASAGSLSPHPASALSVPVSHAIGTPFAPSRSAAVPKAFEHADLGLQFLDTLDKGSHRWWLWVARPARSRPSVHRVLLRNTNRLAEAQSLSRRHLRIFAEFGASHGIRTPTLSRGDQQLRLPAFSDGLE
jgi:hypothetical protein